MNSPRQEGDRFANPKSKERECRKLFVRERESQEGEYYSLNL